MTTSLHHERMSALLALMILALAEETDTNLIAAGRSTLNREDLDSGTEPDSGFYIANEFKMRGRKKIDLLKDPPPDLAIEVEVTRRSGVRRSIYEEIGVPEIWVHGVGGLRVFLRRNGVYREAKSSPTLPLLSPAELSSSVKSGLSLSDTAFIKKFRRRVREALKHP